MKVAEKLEPYRIRESTYGSTPGLPAGAFDRVPGPCGEKLTILASDGADTGWQHVSVSTRRRCPNWREMCFVKNLFWEPEECVVQFHPPASRYVNNYSTVLHMWRCIDKEFPTPPDILVGYKELGTLR
jgi:hypothetical protein